MKVSEDNDTKTNREVILLILNKHFPFVQGRLYLFSQNILLQTGVLSHV